jgi:hypothetical protein
MQRPDDHQVSATARRPPSPVPSDHLSATGGTSGVPGKRLCEIADRVDERPRRRPSVDAGLVALRVFHRDCVVAGPFGVQDTGELRAETGQPSRLRVGALPARPDQNRAVAGIRTPGRRPHRHIRHRPKAQPDHLADHRHNSASRRRPIDAAGSPSLIRTTRGSVIAAPRCQAASCPRPNRRAAVKDPGFGRQRRYASSVRGRARLVGKG